MAAGVIAQQFEITTMTMTEAPNPDSCFNSRPSPSCCRYPKARAAGERHEKRHLGFRVLGFGCKFSVLVQGFGFVVRVYGPG